VNGAKRVAVTGATGTIGAAVCKALAARGDHPIALSRDPSSAERKLGGIEAHAWADPTDAPAPTAALSGANAVVHLLGEPIAQRWTAAAKQRIRDSRVLATRNLVAALQALSDDQRPDVLVSQSASGFYGPRGSEIVDEQSSGGNDFLAGVVEAWEREAQDAERSLRVVRTRTGVVLSPSGGALAQMLPFFRAGVGGPVAGGRQYVPWVHLDDVVAAILSCVDNGAIAGAVNVVAPEPVTNRELSRSLGRALHRPAILPVPGFALRLLYGEMAMVVTTGQRVVPTALLDAGFQFAHPEINAALEDVIGSGGEP
jgi:uncharacterized protein (TIGR01777 family)